jgi:serine/threonine-protein kinase
VQIVVWSKIKLVKVPELIGLTTADATNLLAERDLELSITGEVPSNEFEPGQVVTQDPPADERVEPGTFINVTVASGPEFVTIGDYTCQNFNKAKKAVEALDLIVSYGGTAARLPQCPNNENFVVQQDPGSGAEVEPGSTVTLWTGEDEVTTATPTP